MRILVVGAGATGGYFGGRLLEAGGDVTFLVRPARATRLAETGLAIKSPAGDVALPPPPTVPATDLRNHFDVVLLSCKAHDLDAAIESVAPAVGPRTAVLPLLNGMRHLDALDARFGPGRVLGGSCFILGTQDIRSDRAQAGELNHPGLQVGAAPVCPGPPENPGGKSAPRARRPGVPPRHRSEDPDPRKNAGFATAGALDSTP
jgi:2-dehydropantoate 2-reductase